MKIVSSEQVRQWLREDGFGESQTYWASLPRTPVSAVIKVKSPLVLAGLPWFVEVFETLETRGQWDELLEWEGRVIDGPIEIKLPGSLNWAAAVSGERLALNLLHRASAIATATRGLVEKAKPHGVRVLDTRKTTPGLRELEKYAVSMGGGSNHRFTQVDTWMVKDNHKTLMGLKGAVEFFRNLNQPYKNLVVEIHSMDELAEARALGVTHFMLDNFSRANLQAACASKRAGEFFEVSGGINLQTIENAIVNGVDAVSAGYITMFPPSVDISFKFKPVTL